MTKISASVPRESNWLVLVAMMLIYCPPTGSLEKSRTRNRCTTWSGLIRWLLQFNTFLLYACIILLLMNKGMEKINFSGGEPFIHQKGKFVGELVRYCKEDLQLPSVTIVSNGSLITEEWFQEYGT